MTGEPIREPCPAVDCVQLLCDEHIVKRECTRCVNKTTKMARTDLGMIFTDTHNRLMIRTQMITGLSQLLNVDGITLPPWEQVQAHGHFNLKRSSWSRIVDDLSKDGVHVNPAKLQQAKMMNVFNPLPFRFGVDRLHRMPKRLGHVWMRSLSNCVGVLCSHHRWCVVSCQTMLVVVIRSEVLRSWERSQ